VEHLKYLSWANYAMGALTLLGCLALLALAAITGGLGLSAGAEIGDLMPGLMGPCIGSLVTLLLASLFFMSASGVARGKRRGLQTVMAVLTICNCPGLFYAIYALWVCYGNESTKTVFEEGGLIPE